MFILCAVLLLGPLIPIYSTLFDEAWHGWTLQHAKVYQNQTEAAFRRAVWEKNVEMVLGHNQEVLLGRHNFTLGLNHLADMMVEEVNQKLNGFKMDKVARSKNHTWKNLTLPSSVDWRSKGLVGPVQNQGICGSCWAFSSLGALEGQMKKRTGVLVPLSPQNLVDCSAADGNHGCKGGYITKAYRYIIRNRGVDSEKSYPYEHQNGKCRYSARGKAGYCSSFSALPWGDERALQAAVARVGPLAVAVNAMLPSFHLYRGGIYDDPDCNAKLINHAVLLVGYGSDDGRHFWLLKNSWGPAWGEDGFIRIIRNKKNACGIATFAVYPQL
ncbi:cathepsin S, ortholog 1 isoform X1 [Vanacampus margaritifer]